MGIMAKLLITSNPNYSNKLNEWNTNYDTENDIQLMREGIDKEDNENGVL